MGLRSDISRLSEALKDSEDTVAEQVEHAEKAEVFCVQASNEANDVDSMLLKEPQAFALMGKRLHLAQGSIAHHAEILDSFKKQLAAAESKFTSSLQLLRVERELFKAGLVGYTAQAKELNRRLKEAHLANHGLDTDSLELAYAGISAGDIDWKLIGLGPT
ncbi:hypothetical protein PHMEG_00024053 [Phytophthora megakarya]|uniref:Uncharacterized protein n=1 Tax=Phytophthora megakarya TaxID=4795 RepID=A0A225VFD4_9STRA|nr:hypothetical protein PHMEG_00024053 [Phytophthora megakarya]